MHKKVKRGSSVIARTIWPVSSWCTVKVPTGTSSINPSWSLPGWKIAEWAVPWPRSTPSSSSASTSSPSSWHEHHLHLLLTKNLKEKGSPLPPVTPPGVVVGIVIPKVQVVTPWSSKEPPAGASTKNPSWP